MNWKYTAVVSGATLLATWFASAPPVPRTATPSAEIATAPTTGTVHTDDEIVREADRLSARLHPQIAYQEPSRNPFRFGAPPRVQNAPRVAAPVAPSIVPPAPSPEGPSLRVNLTGIA